MSEDHESHSIESIKDLTLQLQNPISDLPHLLSLLVIPLESMGLLPPAYRSYLKNNEKSNFKKCFQLYKHLPLIQSAILNQIIPTWTSVFQEQRLDQLLIQYFSPEDTSLSAKETSGEVALCAYSTLLSCPLQSFTVNILQKLVDKFPINRIFSVIYSRSSGIALHRRPIIWEDTVRVILSIPSKIANFNKNVSTSEVLEYDYFFSKICLRLESIISSLSSNPESGEWCTMHM